MALDAINNYQRIPINTEISQNDWQACWERAITLVMMLGKGAADKINDTKQLLLDALYTVTKWKGWLAWKVSDLLQRVKRKLEMEQSAEVANKLATLARDYDTDTEQVQIVTAWRLFRHAASWFNFADDKAEAAAMTVQFVECYVR